MEEEVFFIRLGTGSSWTHRRWRTVWAGCGSSAFPVTKQPVVEPCGVVPAYNA
jgi:hypothetical protein